MREPESVPLLRIRAVAQAADGMTLRDAITFHATAPMYLTGQIERTVPFALSQVKAVLA